MAWAVLEGYSVFLGLSHTYTGGIHVIGVSLVTKFPGANGSQNQSLWQHSLNITAYDLSDHKGNACP